MIDFDADDLLSTPLLARRALLRGMAALPLVGAAAASAAPPSATAFIHPGLLHTEADFLRMKTAVAAGAQPWADGWHALTSSGHAQIGPSPRPSVTVIRGGDGQNFAAMTEDMRRAYQYALRWKISGDTAYADAAVRFLDAWSSTMTTLTGNADRFLAAGIYGYQWANAAEIMRTYSGWSAQGVARFQSLLINVFYPLNHQFLVQHNGAVITNYWANWDLCTVAGMLAIGVFCDRRDVYEEAIAYYRDGRGNGTADHMVYCVHPGKLGQWQESGRDQGHATLGIALAGMVCEMAWNQGIDLYATRDNRLLAGAEYVARSNLANPDGSFPVMPYAPYSNNQGTSTGVSPAALGAMRPCWESLYHHYVNRCGLSAPNVAAMAAKLRPENDHGNSDQPSHGTLTFSRTPIDKGARPSRLTAHLTDGAVELSWWGSAYATSYLVERSTKPWGPFTVVGQVSDPRTLTDQPGDGTWFYHVTSMSGSTRLLRSPGARVTLPMSLHQRLAMNSDGESTRPLIAGAVWGPGRNEGKALLLDGVSAYAALPAGMTGVLHDFTFSAWVWRNDSKVNTRIFDFGSSDIVYMALTPCDSRGRLRFMVTRTTYFGEQSIVANALPVGAWSHVTLTLKGRVAVLYVNGVEVGRHSAIDLPPFQLGATKQNWLGRSQYPADPYFNGRLQDVRLYHGALNAEQVAALAV
jgi:Concanavalin A-like lectin/glucanases superfamily/Alginate lyase